MVPMELVGVRVEVPANTPVVVLREQENRQRLLAILIGNPEASAIHSALEGLVPARPLTHDLVVNVLDALKVGLTSVVVTEMRDHTFYAELHLRVGGDEQVISCRPSDGIALAVRTGATIYASEELLDLVGQEPEPEADEEEAILDEFRDFLDDISPEDFAG